MNSPWTTQLALNPMAHDFIRKNSRAIGHRREVSETEGGKAMEGRGRDCGDPATGMPTATEAGRGKEQSVLQSTAATMISDIWPPEISKDKFLLF